MTNHDTRPGLQPQGGKAGFSGRQLQPASYPGPRLQLTPGMGDPKATRFTLQQMFEALLTLRAMLPNALQVACIIVGVPTATGHPCCCLMQPTAFQ